MMTSHQSQGRTELTTAQRTCLQKIADTGPLRHSDPICVVDDDDGYDVLGKLIHSGLVQWRGGRRRQIDFSITDDVEITDAGRASLSKTGETR